MSYLVFKTVKALRRDVQVLLLKIVPERRFVHIRSLIHDEIPYSDRYTVARNSCTHNIYTVTGNNYTCNRYTATRNS